MHVRELAPDEEVLPPGFIQVPDTPGLSFSFGGSEGGSEVGVRDLQPDEEVIPLAQSGGSLSRTEQFGRGSNIGIAGMMGAPVDLMNAGLGLVGLGSEEPIGGSQQIRRGFAALGLAPPVGVDDPDSLFNSMGQVTGAAASMLIPIAPMANFATKILTGAQAPARTVAGAIAQDIGASMVTTPGRFIAAESVSAAAAGAGGFAARERFPDSQAASIIGEIIGGLTPAGVIGAVKVLPTVLGATLARRIVKPFTQAGGKTRAEDRAQALARDPEQAAAQLEARGGLVEEAGLTPAQQAGDEGLLSLEKSIIESSEQLKNQSEEQIAAATAVIRGNLADLGEGVSPEKTAVALEEARNYVKSLLDTRMRIAAQKADERIADLAPGATREQANIIAREELESALSAVRAQEAELWALVPESVVLPTKGVTDAFARLAQKTPRAQQDDIPAIAKRFLDPESNEVFAATETVAELQGLRSKLLGESRKARAAGDFNEARIADELAEAVLVQLGAQRDNVTGEAGEALRGALDFSAELNVKFKQGSVGKLLKSERTGGAKTPAELTLERTVGQGGPRARVETKALLEAVETTAKTPALRSSIEDFLRDDFKRRVAPKGTINKASAETFLARHRDVLEDFPELRTKFEDAIEASDASILAAKKAEGLQKRLDDPKISRAAIFLKEPIDNAMQRISRSRNPEKAMQEIIKEAGRDTTGDAVKGLKTAFGDFLLQKASTGKATTAGEFVLSGAVLKRLLKDGPIAQMAKGLLSEADQKRLQEIADVTQKVERAVKAKGRPEGIVGDPPSLLFQTLAGITGAKVGRALNTGTIQAPGFVASLFRRIQAKLSLDPARRLLVDAIGDKELLSALLNTETTASAQKIIRKQLNGWLASIGAEQIRDSDRDVTGSIEAPVQTDAGPANPPGGASSGKTVEPVAESSSAGRVSDGTVDAIIQQESGGDPNAVSKAGAIGLAQIMPKTAKDPGFGVTPVDDPRDPKQAKRFIREYFGAMLKRYGGDHEAALVAYNWGPGNADRWVKQGKKKDKLPKETRNYVKKLLPKVRG